MISEDFIFIDEHFNTKHLSGKVFLVISNPIKLPPHIGILINEMYFSLTVNGFQKNKTVFSLLRKSSSLKLPIICLELKSSNHEKTDLINKAEVIFEKYERVKADGPSCLKPVLEFLENVYSFGVENVKYIYELIPILQKKSMIKSVSATEIIEYFPDNKYYFLKYTDLELRNELVRLINSKNEIKGENNSA